MTYLINVFLLFLISFVIIAVISFITYFLVFRKYKNKLEQDDIVGANTTRSRLKYCLNCGSDLDKKGFCKLCRLKY